MRYSSKDQEQFFQPLRIQILRDEHGYTARHNWSRYYDVRWPVIKWNTVERRIDDILLWGGEAPVRWWGELDQGPMLDLRKHSYPPGYYHWRFDPPTKADAVKAAKEQAIALNLPFNLQADVGISSTDVIKGSMMNCPLCGKESRRGTWPADNPICTSCQRLYEKGQRIAGSEQEYLVDLYDMLPGDIEYMRYYHMPGEERTGGADRRDLMESLIESIANSTLGRSISGWANKETPRLKLDLESQRYDGMQPITMTPDRAEAIQLMIESYAILLRRVAWHSYKAGSNLVARLASGEVHPDDFSDLRLRAGEKK